MGWGVAFRSFYRALVNPEFSNQVQQLLDRPAQLPAGTPTPAAEPIADALQLLVVLQRDGRLLDFFAEDITGYSDAQVGAAVREIHRDCKVTLDKYMTLAPVLAQEEEATIEIPAGFDPNEIRLTGNVHGAPPYRATVVHRGWRVQDCRLPHHLTTGSDQRILTPAEVEVK